MEDFGFLAAGRLVLLAVPATLLIGYLVAQARRRRYALRFTTVEMLDEVAPDRPGWRRHVTAVFLILAATALTLGLARPAVAGETYESVQIVVLAVDTSISMQATDVDPSRIDAARDAAGVFLDSVPEGAAVGLVTFDGVARQMIAPTTRLDAVRRVVDSSIADHRLGEGTAIGEAVFLGVDAIESALDGLAATEAGETDGGAIGAIVVLSDGETTAGRPNDEAGVAARRAGIPVHTVAFGTARGTIDLPGQGRVPVPINEQALRSLARQTDGRALSAVTADELSQVYEDLGSSVAVERGRVEIGDWFTGAALGMLALAGLGSLVWFGRLP